MKIVPTSATVPTLKVGNHTTLDDLNTFIKNNPGASHENLYGTEAKVDGKYEKILYLSKTAKANIGLDQRSLFSANFQIQRKNAYIFFNEITNNTSLKPNDYMAPEEDSAFYGLDAGEDRFRERTKELAGKPLASYASNARLKQDKSGETLLLSPLKAEDARKKARACVNVAILREKHCRPLPAVKDAPMESNRRKSEYSIRDIYEPNHMATMFRKTNNGKTKDRYIRSYVAKEEDGKKIWSAKGSFGECWMFVADSGSRKIVKIPNKKTNPDLSTFEHELSIGKRLNSPQNNILGFSNSVSNPELADGICLISDFAKNGDLSHFYTKMRAAGISKELQRAIALTVIKDMANGILHIQKHDIVHQDLKTRNVVIDADGRFQIIDFGMANEMNKLKPEEVIGSPYAAPEVFRDTLPKELRNELIQKNANSFRSSLKVMLDRPEDSIHLERLAKQAEEDISDERYKPTKKQDIYGIGQTAYQLLTGKLPVDEIKIPSDHKNEDIEIMEYLYDLYDLSEKKGEMSLDPESHGVSKSNRDTKGLVPSLGDTVLDSIFDVLLAPNPDNRIAAQDIGNHEAMKYLQNGEEPAVGSKEVRDLIIAIASGKQKAIDEKKRAFEAKFVPKERAQGNEMTHA